MEEVGISTITSTDGVNKGRKEKKNRNNNNGKKKEAKQEIIHENVRRISESNINADDIAVALKDSDVDSEAVSSGTEDTMQKEVISTASPDVTRINSDFKSPIKKPTDASWSSEDYRQAMETSETNEIIFKSPVKPTASTTAKLTKDLFHDVFGIASILAVFVCSFVFVCSDAVRHYVGNGVTRTSKVSERYMNELITFVVKQVPYGESVLTTLRRN